MARPLIALLGAVLFSPADARYSKRTPESWEKLCAACHVLADNVAEGVEETRLQAKSMSTSLRVDYIVERLCPEVGENYGAGNEPGQIFSRTAVRGYR